MLRLILSCIFFLYSTWSSAGNVKLYEYLQENLEFKIEWDNYSDKRSLSFEYCVASRCEQFVSHNPDFDKFIKFVDVYILYAPGLVDFTMRIGGQRPPIAYIRERYKNGQLKIELSSKCELDNNAEAISCTLHSLIEELSIEMFDVVYDEGARVETPNASWAENYLTVEKIEFNLMFNEKILNGEKSASE